MTGTIDWDKGKNVYYFVIRSYLYLMFVSVNRVICVWFGTYRNASIAWFHFNT